ncbi:MAG: hypothetical protein ABI481_11795 [Pyrinomonadaceae bacterium]
MKSLKEIIFIFAMFIGLALSVPAQNDDQKRPPKEKPPVVDPVKKPPRENPPRGGDRPPKKPGMSFYLVSTDRQGDTA